MALEIGVMTVTETNKKYSEIIKTRYSAYRKGSYEEQGNYSFALMCPGQYSAEDAALRFVEENPKATLKEVCAYLYKVIPIGLAPNDDGRDLLEDED